MPARLPVNNLKPAKHVYKMEDCTVTTETIEGVHYTYYTKNGIVVAECRKSVEDFYNIERWYRDGKIHREDAPAEIWLRGQLTYELWYRDGKVHREDGPTQISYYRGQKIMEYWHRDGKPHRDDGPAIITYMDGKMVGEYWLRDGKQHRDDGPAEILYENGQVISEKWYCDGKLCPIGRLASVIYRNINSIEGYYTGIRMTDNIDEFRDAVKGDAIRQVLRPLPIPIQQAIIPHYCYQ